MVLKIEIAFGLLCRELYLGFAIHEIGNSPTREIICKQDIVARLADTWRWYRAFNI
jgi:hypothetical protein